MVDVFGKTPPQAVDVETAALGGVLTDGTAAEKAFALLDAEMFYREENRLVFAAAAELHRQHVKIDLVTVANHLRTNGKLDVVGGAHFLSSLANAIGSGAHIEYHCKIVLQKYLQRKLIEAGHEIIRIGFDDAADVGDTLTAAERKIADIVEIAAGRVDVKSFFDIVDGSMKSAYRRVDVVRSGKTTGISTGLAELDKRVLGWERSNLIILAGRPGQGKSAVMLHFAKTAAEAGVPVAVFSLEMSAESLTNRLLLSYGGVQAYRFRNGYMTRDEMSALEWSSEQLVKLPVTIDDTAVMSMSQIRAKARALHRAGKCDMVFIDYLQLVKMDLGFGKNVNNAVSEISREAKILAKEINAPVMLLSQLNREVERRADKRPQLSDLRDSGAIEQDADIVMFVYRPEYYRLPNAPANAGTLIVA